VLYINSLRAVGVFSWRFLNLQSAKSQSLTLNEETMMMLQAKLVTVVANAGIDCKMINGT
jgi:hypothetical protein